MDDAKPLQVLLRAFGPGVFPHQMSWILDLPGRGLIMAAKTVADRLPVKADAQVLEVGPGSGYYSVEAARRVPDGTLTLLDIQPEMLERCARRLRRAGLHNFDTHVPDGQRLPFESESFDALFMVTVFGEVAERHPFLAECFRVLRPGGVISITEHHPDPDLETASVVARDLARHGFVPAKRLGWRWAYTLNATRPGALEDS